MAKTATEKTARPLDVRTNSFDDGTFCMILTGITQKQVEDLREALMNHVVAYGASTEVLDSIRASVEGYEKLKW